MKRRGCCLALLIAGLLWSQPAAVVHAQNRNSARDAWQRPAEVMDLLGIHAGSRVADVGCGDGYFVLHLARRVGSEGRVFAVDVDEDALRKVRRAVEEEGFSNVEIVQNKRDDARLPPDKLDVVLTVNAYHEMRDFDAMLRSLHRALKPGGLLAIIDAAGEESASRSRMQSDHTITEALVREDAARNGFRFRSKERGFQYPESSRRRDWFFLVFEKPLP